MPVDIFQTGLTGLRVAQGQLATTSHNIANVTTRGYSRQSNIQATTTEFFQGGNYTGTGVLTSDIRRSFLSFVYFDLVRSQTETGYATALSDKLQNINEVMGSLGRDTVLDGMQLLFNDLNAVVDSPSDLGVRRAFIERARASVASWNTLHANISQNYQLVNNELRELT